MKILSIRIPGCDTVCRDEILSYELGTVSRIKLTTGRVIETTQPVTIVSEPDDGFVPVAWGVNQDEKNALGSGR